MENFEKKLWEIQWEDVPKVEVSLVIPKAKDGPVTVSLKDIEQDKVAAQIIIPGVTAKMIKEKDYHPFVLNTLRYLPAYCRVEDGIDHVTVDAFVSNFVDSIDFMGRYYNILDACCKADLSEELVNLSFDDEENERNLFMDRDRVVYLNNYICTTFNDESKLRDVLEAVKDFIDARKEK